MSVQILFERYKEFNFTVAVSSNFRKLVFFLKKRNVEDVRV